MRAGLASLLATLRERLGAWRWPWSRKPNGRWCLVGNVVAEHAHGESGEMRKGSKHFAAGTRVYCLPQQWGDGYERVEVVGLSRRGRRWLKVIMPSKQITNWRAKAVYKPAVLERLGDQVEWETRKQVERWARALRDRENA